MSEIVVAIGFVFFIEGLIYAGFPALIKAMALQIGSLNDSQLRFGGLAAMIVGLFIVWAAH